MLAYGLNAFALGPTPEIKINPACPLELIDAGTKPIEMKTSAVSFDPPPDKPHLIGLTRNSRGQIEPIFSESKTLYSYRDLSGNIDGLLGGWQPLRVIEELPLNWVPGKHPTLTTSPDFSSLNSDLRAKFESGHVLVTANAASHNTDYTLLMATAPQGDGAGSKGRTGVLLFKGKPVIVRLNGQEFILELKGVGAPEGGFNYNDPKNKLAIRGGLVESEVFEEHQLLEHERRHRVGFTNGSSVRSAGYLTFDSPIGKQGYLLRLAPGSIRLSFTGNDSLPNITPRDAVVKMTTAWAELLARGLVPLSHPENLIVLENGARLEPTDYSDIVPIEQFPFQGDGHSFSLKDGLGTALTSIVQLKNYANKSNELFPVLAATVAEVLLKQKAITEQTKAEIETCHDLRCVQELVWQNVIAPRAFQVQMHFGQIPEIVEKYELSDLNIVYTRGSITEYLARELQIVTRRINTKFFENIVEGTREELAQPQSTETRERLQNDLDRYQALNDALPVEQRVLSYFNTTLGHFLQHPYSLTVEGLLAPLTMQEREIASGYLKELSDKAGYFKSNSIKYLKSEIEYLELVGSKSKNESEKHFIAENIREATGRIGQLQILSNADFLLRLNSDRSFYYRLIILPYQSQKLVLDPSRMSRPWYRLHANEVRQALNILN